MAIRSSRTIWLKVALILLPVFTLIGCPWGVAPSKIPFGAEDATAGADAPFNKVANAFLLDLKAGRYSEAYQRTSKGYQKEHSQDQFLDMTKQKPFPRGGGTSVTTGPKLEGPSVRSYGHDEKLSFGSIQLELEVSKEGDDYRISKVTLK